MFTIALDPIRILYIWGAIAGGLEKSVKEDSGFKRTADRIQKVIMGLY